MGPRINVDINVIYMVPSWFRANRLAIVLTGLLLLGDWIIWSDGIAVGGCCPLPPP